MRNVFLLVLTMFGYLSVVAQTDTTKTDNTPKLSEESKLILAKVESFLKLTEKDYIGLLKYYNSRVYMYSYPDVLVHNNLEKARYRALRQVSRKAKRKGLTTVDRKDLNEQFKKTSLLRIDSLEIDSIEMNISEGVIENIRVVTKNKRIFQNERIIPLMNFEYTSERTFLYDTKDEDFLIKLNDFLYFLPRADQNFLPDDELIVLRKPNQDTHPLNLNVDLNSHVEVKVFTDMLALFNQASNGLVQTEVTSRIVYNPTPYRGIFYVNYLELMFRYSKFDSDFKSSQLNDKVAPFYVTPFEQLKMNQLSFINLGIKVNLVRAKVARTFSEANIGCIYDFVNLQLSSDPEALTLANMYGYFFEGQAGLMKSKNFWMNASVMVIGQKITRTEFKPHHLISRAAYIRPEITLFYNPKDDNSSRVFLRFQALTEINYLDSYATLQFGYTTKLKVGKMKD